jgi:hypothetical protein
VIYFSTNWKTLINTNDPFKPSDVNDLNAVVKFFHRIFFEQAYALSKHALNWSGSAMERDVLLDAAQQMYEESLRVKPNDYRSLHNLAFSMYLQATSSVHIPIYY